MTLDLLLQILVSLLVFGSVFLLTWSLFAAPVVLVPPVNRQISAVGAATQQGTIFDVRMLAPIMGAALSAAQRFSFDALRRRVGRDLDASGNPNHYSVDQFVAICLLTGALLGLVGGALAWAMAPRALPLGTLAAAALGFVAPLWSLRLEATRRLVRINKKLPYTLDLIALMMTAGCTFTEAVDSLVEDEPDDDLNQELRLMRRHIEFGARRSQALAELAQRIPLDTLRSVVGAINQSQRLGTPLATILSAQAGMIRMQRSVHAEKLSASASLRILLPSMLILIAAVIVVFAPFVRPLLSRMF